MTDGHDQVRGITENMCSLRTDVINVLPSNQEGKLHAFFLRHMRAPMVHFRCQKVRSC